jgi:cytochrome c biogenesis protein CcmG, thiol:disulfide interchange protein DsbE
MRGMVGVLFAVGVLASAPCWAEPPARGFDLGLPNFQEELERPQARLTLQDLKGKPVTLRELRGKVVLVNFWATWCEPCKTELPVLVDLAERYRSRGLVVVAASADVEDARPDVRKVAETAKALRVWVGAVTTDMEGLGLNPALPASVLIDRDGGISERAVGTLTDGMLDEDVERLLGEARGSGGVLEAALPPAARS